MNKWLTESLTGRFETIRFFHWNFRDSQKIRKFLIDEFLTYGGYPGSHSFIKDKKRWAEYLAGSIIETVIGKDILMQTHVRSPALFRQAFFILATSPKIIPMVPSLSTFFRINALNSEDFGRIFESVVGSELIKAGLELYYWADGTYEVDFIVVHKKQVVAIEVKSGRNKNSISLEKFQLKYPSAKFLFINKENFPKFADDPIHMLDGVIG